MTENNRIAKKKISVVGYVFQALPIEKALPKLLEKILDQNHKVILKFETSEELEHFNTCLWTYHPKSFLPHGKDTAENPADHPILLTTSSSFLISAPNQAIIAISFSLEEILSLASTSSPFEKLIWISSYSFTDKDKSYLEIASKTIPISLYLQKSDSTWLKKDLSS